MWATITKPFAWLFVWLYNLTGNYGAAILLFALAVNLILTPFMAKSKKGMMRQTRLQPKLQELQRRHEGNQQKLNEEMQKLYREEGVNPMGGCLWSLIPFPILIALYSVIRQPFSRMMFAADGVLDAVKEFCVNNGWYTLPAKTDAYMEIKLANIVHEHWDETISHLQGLGLSTKELVDLDFSFLGINLGTVPWDTMKLIFAGTAVVSVATIGLALIPLVSAGLSWLSMKVANMANPQTGVETQQQAQMKSMNLMMPLMSLWFCFIMPAAMGVYWIGNSVFGMIRDFILTKYYKKKLDAEDAVRNAERQKREREMEGRRYSRTRSSALPSAAPPSPRRSAPRAVKCAASRSPKSPPPRSATAATRAAAPTCRIASPTPREPRRPRWPPRRSRRAISPSTRASPRRASSPKPSRKRPRRRAPSTNRSN